MNTHDSAHLGEIIVPVHVPELSVFASPSLADLWYRMDAFLTLRLPFHYHCFEAFGFSFHVLTFASTCLVCFLCDSPLCLYI
jgi:hypothetical protein